MSNGCNEKKVGQVIQAVGAMMGIKVTHRMSQQTVQRCIMEGGIAAKIQAADEMSNTDSMYHDIASAK